MKLKFLFSFNFFMSMKLRAMRSYMTKSTTIVTHNVFRSTRLFRNGSSNLVLFSLQLMTLRSYMTNRTTLVTSWNKRRSIQNLSLRPKWRLWLKSLSLHLLISFVWRNVHRFVFEVEHTISTKLGTTTWLQQILSFLLLVGSAIKHLACILSKFSIQVHIQTFKLF